MTDKQFLKIEANAKFLMPHERHLSCTYLYPDQIFVEWKEAHLSQCLTGMIKPNSISVYL